MKRLFTLIVISSPLILFAFPIPHPVPQSWELDFKYQPLKRITVNIPGEGQKTFWYMIYTITNNTNETIYFKPRFTIVTDKLDIIQAQINVDPIVFKKIKKLYKPTYPWLEHPVKIIGKILQGKDNARDSVAIWPDFGPNIKTFDLYIAGLSGEAVKIPNPLYIKGKSNPKKTPAFFVLRKTLKIHYIIPTDPKSKSRINAIKKSTEWVMR